MSTRNLRSSSAPLPAPTVAGPRRAGVVPLLIGMLAVVLVAGGALLGCFDPRVTSGGLRCAPLPAKQCPDGFACQGGVCVTAGGTGTGGHGGGAGAGGAGGAGGGCAMPIAPLCATTPGNSVGGCDPICQTGCGCGLRCNVSGASAACVPVGSKPLAQGQICAPENDQCAPGLVCLKENCGTNLGRCYLVCRDNSTCGPGGVCGTPIGLPGGGTSPYKGCNVGDQVPACDVYARTGCPDPALVCYVAGPNTKCDCPSGTDRGEGQPCSFYNDCLPGLTCLNLGGISQCHKLCRNNADCGGAVCTITGASGYCP